MKTEKKLKIEKTKRKKTLHYEGESTKNSVVCGAAGVEFALELCVGSSDAVWNALAKRLKVNCGVCRLVCFFLECLLCSERHASGVQQEPRKFMRDCPKSAL